MLRVRRAGAGAAARHLGLLVAAARRGRQPRPAARLHLARVLPEAARALALPARVRAVGGVDRVLRAHRGSQRARHAQQTRERGRDATGQDRVHHRDHQPPRVCSQDAEPLGRRPHLRHVVPGHPALPVQGALQPVGRAAHVGRQHGAQAHPRHALLVIPCARTRHAHPSADTFCTRRYVVQTPGCDPINTNFYNLSK